jgi:uncharacterized protein YprB with RNaseH-like and TPR domain
MAKNFSGAKILFWDIETTHLKADFGTCLCIGYKWAHEKKPHVIDITQYETWDKDRTDDSGVIADFAEVFKQADIVVTYFGKRFDLPYVNAKMAEYGQDFLPNIPHLDLFFTVKSNLALSRKSLQNVGYHLGLSAEKTPVEGRIWKKAATGDHKSVKYIIDHCAADVLILEEAYERLKPLIRQHPRVRGVDPCRVCGSMHLQRRGYAVTTLNSPRIRVQCQDCGSWETRSEKHAEIAR